MKLTGHEARKLLYRPAEAAKMLRCSEWWLKEQARKRRIPFSWIGGSYRFTDEHVAEIIRIFEHQPTEPSLASGSATPRSSRCLRLPVHRSTQLKARTPRRVLKADRSIAA